MANDDDDNDSEGGFADFDSLFGESRVNHGGPGSKPVVWQFEQYEPLTLQVSQQTSTGLMAHFVWQSSMTLAELLLKRTLQPLVDITEQSTVIELGSGAALPSLVCDKHLHAKCTVATDYPDKHVLQAMQSNAEKNKCSSNFHVLGLDWEENGTAVVNVERITGQKHVDYILAADTLWMPQYHTALLKTVLELMGPKTRLVMAFMHHDFDGKVAEGFISQLLQPELKIQLESHTQHNWRKTQTTATTGREEYGDVQVLVFKRICKN